MMCYSRPAFVLLMAVAAVLAAVGCSDSATPTETPPKNLPVVFIPGITGSQLATESGEILWPPGGPGDPKSLRVPGYGDLKSIFTRLSLNPATSHEDLMATDVIRNDGPKEPVYQPLISALSAEGYVEYNVNNDPNRRTSFGCDLTQKGKKPTLFVFAYDWRMTNEESAAKLADYAGCIRRFYPNTKINIVTHSMGGLVARRFIIDNPKVVNKLVTTAAPWLGSPKPVYQMIWGLLAVGGFSNNAAWAIYGTQIKDMLAYYPGLHQLMSTRMYYALGGRPYSYKGATDLFSRDVDYLELMGPGGMADKLFGGKSYNGKTPAQSNRDFHSYTSNGNNQDDWSKDTTGVKYYHLVGVQKSNDTPLKVSESHGINLQEYTWVFSEQGAGDGTVPRLSAERIAADGRSLNAPKAKLFVFDQGDDALLEHTGLMTNPAVISRIIQSLKEKDDEEPTPTPSSTPAPTQTRTPTATPSPTASPTATPKPSPAVTPTLTFDQLDMRYVLKKVQITCGESTAFVTTPNCKDTGGTYYESGNPKPSLEVSDGKTTYIRVGNAKGTRPGDPDTTRTITWTQLPQEIRPGVTYKVEMKGAFTRPTAPFPYGDLNVWLKSALQISTGVIPVNVQPEGYARVGNDRDAVLMQDTTYTINIDVAQARQSVEKNGIGKYAPKQFTLIVSIGGYSGDSGAQAKTSYGAPFHGAVWYTYELTYKGQ